MIPPSPVYVDCGESEPWMCLLPQRPMDLKCVRTRELCEWSMANPATTRASAPFASRSGSASQRSSADDIPAGHALIDRRIRAAVTMEDGVRLGD